MAPAYQARTSLRSTSPSTAATVVAGTARSSTPTGAASGCSSLRSDATAAHVRLELRLEALQVVGHDPGARGGVRRAQDPAYVGERDVELAQAMDDLGDRDLLGAVGAVAGRVVHGHTFRGTDEVLRFLRRAGGDYTYTTELIGAERVDDAHWVAIDRLEGDFPGGVVELRYRFALVDDLIAELVIAL